MAGQGPRSRSPSGTRTQTLEKHRQAKCWRQSRALGHPSALVAYAWPEGAAGVPCCLHHRPYTFNDHQVGLTPSLLDRSAGCFHGPPWARPTSLLPVLPIGAGSSPWTVRSNWQRGLSESTGGSVQPGTCQWFYLAESRASAVRARVGDETSESALDYDSCAAQEL